MTKYFINTWSKKFGDYVILWPSRPTLQTLGEKYRIRVIYDQVLYNYLVKKYRNFVILWPSTLQIFGHKNLRVRAIFWTSTLQTLGQKL